MVGRESCIVVFPNVCLSDCICAAVQVASLMSALEHAKRNAAAVIADRTPKLGILDQDLQ